uniref:Uncharacterized mitochondrial protein AtMg00810-like n=1 Tax=Tanacetum cinerariifolium TaxID=118510 RepID=A0A699HEF1_TANCI|nr:uncharacterized mitochondrial protein AtMg00810-like [Tanacetum cinerariifolium]
MRVATQESQGGIRFKDNDLKIKIQDRRAIHSLSCKGNELFIVDALGDPKGGKITSKGKISTDTKYVVLSPDFKLLDESQVLLRVLRKNNIADKARVETVPDKDYILLPLLTQDPLFSSSSKDSPGDRFKPSGGKKDAKDSGNKDNEVLSTKEPRVNQKKDANVNSTNNINIVSPTANVASIKDIVDNKDIVYGCANDPNMPNLEEINYSDNDEDVGVEANMTNQDSNIPVSPILTTRIHKDHPVEQIIGDIHLALQTKRMTNNVTNYVAKIEAIRLFLAYASFKDFVVYQIDVKSAFLYGKIEEEVYVCQPPGKEMCTEFEKMMHKNIQISSMGELTFFLGLQVTQKDDGIFISQDKYVDEILKKFGLSTVKTASTPMETSKPLLKDENAKDIDVYLYRSMIGSLMYLTSSRFDIMFVVYSCARFQVTPKVSHLHDVKGIFRYLKGQPKLGFWYPKDSPFDLEAYSDSDYAGASLDRKSIIGADYTPNDDWNEVKQLLRMEFRIKRMKKQTERIVSKKEMRDVVISKPDRENCKLTTAIDVNVVVEVVSDEAVYKEMYDSVERAATTAISLDAEQDMGIISKTQFTITLNEPSFIGTSLGSGPSAKRPWGMLLLKLETIKTNKALEIRSLKRRVKKLEKKSSKRTHKLSRLYKIVTLVDVTQGRNDQDMFNTGVLDDEEVVAEKEVSTADPVTTASEVVTTVGVEVSAATTTPTISMDDITLAKVLATLKSENPMSSKDKGKEKMIEPEKPLKKKDQIMIDEEVARNLKARLQAELEEEERLARQKEEEANIALIAEWDDVQAMIDANHKLAKRFQAEEQGELTIKERLKLFVELMNERKKHFTRLRIEEKRRKPPTKAQKRNQMCTYLKNMAGFTHNQLKKEQKLDEKVEAEVDSDQEEAEMKMYMKIISDDEIAIDAIPLATKPPIIVDWKIIKERKISSYHIIRHDGISKRPEEAYERVLWGNLKLMSEADIESEVWRKLKGNKVTVWKLFSSREVHFVWFQNLHIFMLVEKRLSHLNFDYINLLSKKDVVIGLPKLKGTEFLNKTLNAFFKEEGIKHQTSTSRTPEQNGVVERRNSTLVEAARTMMSASKLPLFFWAEAIATACYTETDLL